MLLSILRRIALAVVVLWVTSTVVFGMFFVAPHNVAQMLAGRQATPETVALIERRLGLDRPVLDQYGSFLSNLVQGDLGYSFRNQQPVTSMIADRLPVTLSLVGGAAILLLLIGVGAGVLAATRPRSIADRLVTVGALFFYSMPSFLLGLLLLYVCFYRFQLAGIHLFPGSGYVPLNEDPVQWAAHLVLPWLTIALVTAATYARLTRTSMLEVLGEDYIRTARSKGLRERRVVYRHALRSALTPIVTQFGIDIGVLLGGVVITEYVFGLPGLGQLAIQSVTTQDLPVIIGTVLLASAFVVVANIIVDACYVLLDPRVRMH